MLSEVTHTGNVKIDRFHGPLAGFCAANKITAVVRTAGRQRLRIRNADSADKEGYSQV